MVQKQWMAAALAALVLAATLAGCGKRASVAPDGREEPPASASAAPAESEPEPEAPAVPQTAEIPGLEGDYILLDSAVSATAGEHWDYLADVKQMGNTLILLWNRSNGFEGPAAVEVIHARTGELLYGKELPGYAYALELTGDSSEDYRVLFADRIYYGASGSANLGSEFLLPEAVVGGIGEQDYYSGAPYDYDRAADLLVWSGAEGIYRANGAGEDARLLLENAGIEGELPRIPGGEIPNHTPEQLRYVAPVLLDSGKHLGATAWFQSNGDTESCPLAPVMADAETGAFVGTASYSLQLVWLSQPPWRLGGGSLLGIGHDGSIRITAEGVTMGLPLNPATATWDGSCTVALDQREGRDALILRTGEAGAGETVLLTGEQGQLAMRDMTQEYAFCVAFEGEEDATGRLFAVPYEQNEK